MSEPLLLAASLLSGETSVGMTSQPKPDPDLWQMIDQLEILDQQKVQAYQRRSQPLSQQATVTQPETSHKLNESPPYNKAKTSPPPQPQPTPDKLRTTPAKVNHNPVDYNPVDYNPVDYNPTVYGSPQTLTPKTFTPKNEPQNPAPPASVQRNPLPSNTNTQRRPSSNSQLFSQRMNALHSGKIYTRLKANSFETAWATVQHKPTHADWKTLLQQEAKSVAAGQGSNKLGVLVGDSLSMWFPSDLLPEGKLWLNQGISGENTNQVLQRLNALDQVRPETIYVMAGVNDLKQGASDATVLNNSRAIIRRLRYQHPYATIVVQSLLPTRMSYLSPERAARLNKQLRTIAAQENAGYLNLHALFVDGQGKMREDLTTDGLHLNRQGYKVWQQAMQKAEQWVASANVS